MIRHAARTNLLLLSLACAAAAPACALSTSDGDDEGYWAGDLGEPEDTAAAEQPILGGAAASEGEYPFMAALTISGPLGSFGCAGTLVAPKYVLTAAHCVVDSSRSGTSLPGDLTVVIGRTTMSSTGTGETRTVAEVIVNPKYRTGPGNWDHDIAVLRLGTASTFTPVAVASAMAPGDRALWKTGTVATAVGWGRTCDSCPGTNTLREVTLAILEGSTASDIYGSDFYWPVHLAAGPESGSKGTCQGDSGGPLLVPSGSGWKVAGVTSWGASPCGTAPPVFARVGGYRLSRWLETVIHQTPAVGDVNGDGKDDIVTFTHGSAASGPLDVLVALSTGSSFGATAKWNDWFAHYGHTATLGDLNGDGKDDAIVFTDQDTWVALSTGSGFNGGVIQSAPVLDQDDVPLVGDVNGDGKDDIVILNADLLKDTYVMLSTGFGWGAKTKWRGSFLGEGDTPGVADVNGDGKDDIVRFRQGYPDSALYVALSTGAAFGSVVKWKNTFAFAGEHPLLGRFDSGARHDAVAVTANGSGDLFVSLSTGSAFGVSVKWHDTFAALGGTYRVGDVNGDGRDDLVRFSQDAAADVHVTRSNGSSFGASALWHGNFAP